MLAGNPMPFGPGLDPYASDGSGTIAAFEKLPVGAIGRINWNGSIVDVRQGSYILRVDDSTPLSDQRAVELSNQLGAKLGVQFTKVRSIGRGRWAGFDSPVVLTPQNLTPAIAAIPGIEGVEPDRVFGIQRLPNDPALDNQWYHNNTGQFIGAPGKVGADIKSQTAWDITIGSRSTVIGVIDSGVDYTHPDLAANIFSNPGEIAGNGIDDDANGFIDDIRGWDFGDLDNNPQDDILGHGTQVAGTLGAVGNDGRGMAGVNWDVSILPLKIADRFGILVGSAIIGAHDYATMMRQAGINVVATNNSYRGIANDFYSDLPTGIDAEKDAIERYIASGGTFVASAGNDALDNDSNFTAYPASYNLPGLISVAATDNQDNLASFSNYGAETVDLAAPGVFTYSTTVGGGYGFPSGTSFSGPIVAGAVGLLKTYRPDASAVEIRKALIDSSDQVPSLQNRVVSGGRLNIRRALDIIGLAGPTVRLVTPGPVSGQLDASTSPQVPIDKVTVRFNKPIDAASVSTANFRLIGAGTDDVFGSGDDVVIPVASVAAAPSSAETLVATLDLSGFASSRLPIDSYRLTLRAFISSAAQIRDTDGNLLNGNSASGVDYSYDFRIVSVTGDFESNDTLASATPVSFGTSGAAEFTGVTLGNGIFGNNDVDLYRIDLPKGGQITTQVFAQRRALPSTLDSYIRLFNAAGEQLSSNDQFFGSDSFISYFVSTGGTYYIGVSSFPNTTYDPTLGGSGSAPTNASLPALYDLTIGVQLLGDERQTIAAPIPGGGLRIPFDPSNTATLGTTTTTFTVTDTRSITDLNLRFSLNHTFDADLLISLRSPSGRTVTLVNQRGGDQDNFTNTLLDDEALTPLSSGTAPFSGGFKPDNPLSAFDGLSALGTWTMTIQDLSQFNTGVLLSAALEFTLENNVFGPFESNDTTATATTATGISSSSGGASRFEAFIGDGGFGQADRDIYRFDVSAGSTFNAAVYAGSLPFGGTGLNFTPGSDSLNTALRLFDSQGTELKLANPGGTKNATIGNFVFTTSGTYYIAVSESANVAYAPNDINSGSNGATTGGYVLEFTVSPGVSDSDLILAGNQVSAGVRTNAAFGSNAGLSYQGQQFLYRNGVGNPEAFFAGAAGGSTFRNDAGSINTNPVPFTITDQSDTYNRRMFAVGSLFTGLGELKIERDISFGVADGFLTFDIYLRNNSANNITNVSWMEALNPQQGANLVPATNSTLNDLADPVNGTPRYASARATSNAFQSGLTIAMAASKDQAYSPTTRFISSNLVVRDPTQVFDQPLSDPNGASSDDLMAITFDVGTIAAGQTARLRYFVFFGSTPAQAEALYTSLDAGTGSGHLVQDTANPGNQTLLQPDGVTNVDVPQLPYRLYYPEGFANSQTYTFLPIVNNSSQQTRVVVIARYELDPLNPNLRRDQIVADLSLNAGQRSGLTITSPELYANNTLLVDKDRPYALEIRAERPVSATFSHYDQFLLSGGRAAIGQAFTTRIGTEWTFGQALKGPNVADFLLYMNTTDQTIKVTTTFYPQEAGAQPFVFTQSVEPYRRSGINFNSVPQLANGTYGLVVKAQGPVVASLSHYNSPDASTDNKPSAYGFVGLPSSGSSTGAAPEGQIGLNSTIEHLAVLNAGAVQATVNFEFIFANGTSYRASLTVPKASQRSLDVGALANFPTGQPYAIKYTSNTPVTVVQPSIAFSNGLANTFSDKAYSYWGFGEGFRPANNATNVTEYLRLYNPNSTDVLVEITLRYDNGQGEESFRQTIPARRVSEINLHDLVTGGRRFIDVFYGTTVKSQLPIVAYMGHYDPYFPGAFGTLGTPLGISTPIV
jgi:subtilisin-like proprotein convertase family protein